MAKDAQTKTEKIELRMVLEVDKSVAAELKFLEHHIECLVDLDNWPEIHSVSGVSVEPLQE